MIGSAYKAAGKFIKFQIFICITSLGKLFENSEDVLLSEVFFFHFFLDELEYWGDCKVCF
jgi:hypothetical protein